MDLMSLERFGIEVSLYVLVLHLEKTKNDQGGGKTNPKWRNRGGFDALFVRWLVSITLCFRRREDGRDDSG